MQQFGQEKNTEGQEGQADVAKRSLGRTTWARDGTGKTRRRACHPGRGWDRKGARCISQMLRIWTARKGKAIPHPTSTRASLESREVSSAESHCRDSHGRFAQGQGPWEAPVASGRGGRRSTRCRASAGRMVALVVRAAGGGTRSAFVCKGTLRGRLRPAASGYSGWGPGLEGRSQTAAPSFAATREWTMWLARSELFPGGLGGSF